ncbi:MAG: hypothetical protein WCC06_12095 [Candidatus Aminicenantales bacterium]
MRKKIVFALFFLVLVNFASAFRVTPARLDLTINRGTTQEVVLILMGSKSVKPETLMVFPTDISMLQNGSLKFDRLEGFKNSAVPWIKLEQTNYTLLEKQTKELKFKISVPMSADPGEYYSVVMVEPTEFSDIKAKDKPLVLQMKSRLAVVIVIDVPGRIYEKKGDALSASVQEENGKLKILSTFNNAGNIHLDVAGTASIRSKDGKTRFGQVKLLATGNLKEEAFIFPGNMRDFEGVMDKQLPKGEYVVDVMFDYGAKIKKAMASSNFSIFRETNADESKVEFLIVDKKIEVQVPVGALRTKVVKISNSDYRVINVSFVSDSWVQVEPQSFALEPGQDKNIKLTISNDGKSQKETTIVVKPDRGMPSEIKLSLTEKAKAPEKSKKRSG